MTLTRGAVLLPREYRGETTPPASLEDESRYGNDAIFGAGATAPTWVQLPSGLWVLNFVDATAQFAYSADAPSLDITDTITMLAWYNPNSLAFPGVQQIFVKGAAGNLNQPWGCYLFNDTFYGHWHDGANWRRGYATLTTTGWNHMVVVLVASTDTIDIYFNGASQAVTKSGTGVSPMLTDANLLRIGGDGGAAGCDGDLALFKIFNYPLSAAQIYAMYNAERSLFGA